MALGFATAEGEGPADATAPAGAPAAEHPPQPGLPHVPALDGLRGLAVAAVVVFHLGHLRGGFLGVDLFFVLSGFLITSLLLSGRRGAHGVDLGLFWSRRARRLLPALLLVLIGVAVMVALWTPEAQRHGFRGDSLATLGYVANWHAMGHQTSYWDLFTQPSPLDHMWSLAIEEQFYLVWPLAVGGLLVLAHRRGHLGHRAIAAVAGAGALASFAVLALTWSAVDPNRAYYGTDARVGPTLLGAALAALWVRRPWAAAVPTDPGGGPVDDPGPPPSAPARTGWWAPLAGLASLLFLVWSFARVEGTTRGYYQGGLAAFALAAIVLMAIVLSGRGGPVAAFLSWRPLRVLGLISYGVYLWHWPVIVFATPERTHVSGPAHSILVVTLTLAVAGLSYVLVERPVRRGALSGWRVPVSLVGAVAAAGALALVVTAGTAPAQGPALLAEGAGSAAYPLHLMPSPIPTTGPRIMLVGDSGPIFLGPALSAEAAKAGASVASDSQYGCTPLDPEGVTRWGDGILRYPPCHDHRRAAWRDMIERFDPDVVVYYIASLNVREAMLLDGDWVADCDPPYDAYLREALGGDVDVLASGGAKVAMATTPIAPAVGVYPGGVDMLACRNRVYEQVVAGHPASMLVDMKGAVAVAASVRGKDAFRDAVHLSDFGAQVVSRWIVPLCLALRDGRPPPSVEDTLGDLATSS
jgi:peptidoglycan/LPS O-acetylase OafA/YrhL